MLQIETSDRDILSGNNLTVCNALRVFQCILCLSCLTIAIHIVTITFSWTILLMKLILITTASSFFIITLVDIIGNTMYKPMLWTTWILFAIIGSLMFALCVGFLLLGKLPIIVYIFAVLLNIFACLAFLLDIMCIISWIMEVSSREPERKFDVFTTSTFQQQIIENTKALQNSFTNVRQKSILQKSPCTKDTCGKKIWQPKVPSHGGTFHVSKDVAPILCPNTTASNQATCIYFDKRLAEIESNTPKQYRTVSTSARVVQKQETTGEDAAPFYKTTQDRTVQRKSSTGVRETKQVEDLRMCNCSVETDITETGRIKRLSTVAEEGESIQSLSKNSSECSYGLPEKQHTNDNKKIEEKVFQKNKDDFPKHIKGGCLEEPDRSTICCEEICIPGAIFENKNCTCQEMSSEKHLKKCDKTTLPSSAYYYKNVK